MAKKSLKEKFLLWFKNANKWQLGIITALFVAALAIGIYATNQHFADKREKAEEIRAAQVLNNAEKPKNQEAAVEQAEEDKATEEDKKAQKDKETQKEKAVEAQKEAQKEQEQQKENNQTKATISDGSAKGKDQYKTDPVPRGKPNPVEPQNTKTDTSKTKTCTLSVRCDTILNNMDKLKENKKSLVPSNGVIYSTKTVTFYEGESVFDILKREMQKSKIHLEFVNTPIYNSAYIEGINNLYEFDCGDVSGWIYKVNGWAPNYGCSRYLVENGDKIEWVYSCDLGRDVGAAFIRQD